MSDEPKILTANQHALGWFLSSVLLLGHGIGWSLGWWPIDSIFYYVGSAIALILCILGTIEYLFGYTWSGSR